MIWNEEEIAVLFKSDEMRTENEIKYWIDNGVLDEEDDQDQNAVSLIRLQ